MRRAGAGNCKRPITSKWRGTLARPRTGDPLDAALCGRLHARNLLMNRIANVVGITCIVAVGFMASSAGNAQSTEDVTLSS